MMMKKKLQVIGQALAAAASTVAEGFIPNSLHSYFLKCGECPLDLPFSFVTKTITI